MMYLPLLVPLSFVAGWFMSHKAQRDGHHKQKHTALSREYYVGLNYLLNEQPDKAVDVFIKLLEVDSSTVETHLALASLFRRRGEVDRAIRIHQNLIARPQLSHEQRAEALLSLGRDYMSAGVFDRAERIFHEVVLMGGENTKAGLLFLLDIFQQEKAWDKAIAIVQKLQAESGEKQHRVIAHHYCELSEEASDKKHTEQAKRYVKQAMIIDKDCVRASLLQGRYDMRQGRFKQAIKHFKRVKSQDADFISEAIPDLATCYEQLGLEDEFHAYLRETLQDCPRISIVLMLALSLRASKGVDAAADFFAEQLRQNPSIKGVSILIDWHLESAEGRTKAKLHLLRDVTRQLLENKPKYRCRSCGFSGKNIHWHCPSCKQWGVVKPIHGLEGD